MTSLCLNSLALRNRAARPGVSSVQTRVRPRERGDLMGCHSRAGPLPQRVSLSRMSVRTTQIATLNVIINIKPLEKMTNDQ